MHLKVAPGFKTFLLHLPNECSGSQLHPSSRLYTRTTVSKLLLARNTSIHAYIHTYMYTYTRALQPFHHCLLPSANAYSTFHSVTNPYCMRAGGASPSVSVLGTAGQNVTDVLVSAEFADCFSCVAVECFIHV
jgi:hypothetical protein